MPNPESSKPDPTPRMRQQKATSKRDMQPMFVHVICTDMHTAYIHAYMHTYFYNTYIYTYIAVCIYNIHMHVKMCYVMLVAQWYKRCSLDSHNASWWKLPRLRRPQDAISSAPGPGEAVSTAAVRGHRFKVPTVSIVVPFLV